MARLTMHVKMPSERAEGLPLRWRERLGVMVFALAIVAYGMVTMINAEAGSGHGTELRSVLGAGWAVRSQKNLYAIPSEFTGPPVLAVLVAPLAQPTLGAGASDIVPWVLAVAISYFFNVLCLIVAIHWLAGTAESYSISSNIRHWWYVRVMPALVLLVPLGMSGASGTSHAMVLLLVAGMFRNLVGRQSFGAGVCLGAAMCLQVSVDLLVLLPIWRRDRQMTIGTVLGVALGMLLLPGLVFGLQGTNQLNAQYLEIVKQTLVDKVDWLTAWISPMFSAPLQGTTIAVTWMVGSVIVLSLGATLIAAGNPKKQNPERLLLVLGCMLAVISLIDMQASQAQGCYLLPMVIGLIMQRQLHEEGAAGRTQMGGMIVAGLCVSMPFIIPGLQQMGTLLLWGMGVYSLAGRTSKAGIITRDGEYPSLPKAA